MARLKYSSYVPSKTLWQKEIPSLWQETELRMLFADNKNKNIGLVERNLLSLSYGKLKRKDIDNATGLVPASFEGYQIIDEGYIVLRFTDLQNDKKSLRVGYVEEKGIITSAYIGLAPKADIHSKYFYYQLHFLDKIKYFYNLGGGVRQSLAFKEFGRETVLLPPKEEQTAIARFLDYKLAKINRFIQKKKQLIKLLNEQKAAIINQAVTKGLDANAKMKPSGIEWLGDIPEHWEVRKLKYVAKVKTGKTPKIESSLVDFFENGTVDWFTPGDFGNEGILSDSNRKINELAINDSQISLFPEKTVFMVGIGGTIGKIGICFDESSCNQQINALIFNNLIEPLYAYYFLKTQKHQIDLLADFTTLPILNQSKTKDVIFVYPKKDEQQQIVSHIEKETTIINTTISKIEKELALVEEYKTALIAEAVTGKIDVRNYEIPTITEPETYDELEDELYIAAEDEPEYQNEDVEE